MRACLQQLSSGPSESACRLILHPIHACCCASLSSRDTHFLWQADSDVLMRIESSGLCDCKATCCRTLKACWRCAPGHVVLMQTLAKAPSPSSRRRPCSSFAKTMSCVASRLPSLAAASWCALALALVLSEDVLRRLRQHHQIRTPAAAAAATHGMPIASPILSAVLAPCVEGPADACQ